MRHTHRDLDYTASLVITLSHTISGPSEGDFLGFISPRGQRHNIKASLAGMLPGFSQGTLAHHIAHQQCHRRILGSDSMFNLMSKCILGHPRKHACTCIYDVPLDVDELKARKYLLEGLKMVWLTLKIKLCSRLRILHDCLQCMFLIDAKIMHAIYKNLNGHHDCRAHTTSDTYSWLSNLEGSNEGQMRHV